MFRIYLFFLVCFMKINMESLKHPISNTHTFKGYIRKRQVI
jgi:hypothetical protein